jgi:hypothetical protein
MKVINHLKNGEEFDPTGFILPYETTKALIEKIGLSAFIAGLPATDSERG